ncbi:MAG: hypothetical protein ACXWRZ_14670 [Bdellovibrio sp.]
MFGFAYVPRKHFSIILNFALILTVIYSLGCGEFLVYSESLSPNSIIIQKSSSSSADQLTLNEGSTLVVHVTLKKVLVEAKQIEIILKGTQNENVSTYFNLDSSTFTIPAGVAAAEFNLILKDDLVNHPTSNWELSLQSTDKEISSFEPLSFSILDNDPPVVLGSISIVGVKGGSDITPDAWLSGDSDQPTVVWNAVNNASSYDVSILNYDGSTVKCPAVNVTSGTSYTFTGCNLNVNQSYKIKIQANSLQGETKVAPLFTISRVGLVTMSNIEIENDTDDGLIISDAPNHGSGLYPQNLYAGEWLANYRDYAYFRFKLPQSISPDSVIVSASLSTFLLNDNSTWNSAIDSLEIWAQKTANAPIVENQTQYPGDIGGTVLTNASVVWSDGPAQGLSIQANAWNTVPEIKDIIQELVNNYSKFTSGSYIQLWMAAHNLRGQGHEISIRDVSSGTSGARLSISYEVRGPMAPQITGITGGNDGMQDNNLTDGTHPTIHWIDVLGEDQYSVSIYEADGVTIKCNAVQVPADSTSINLSSCDLSPKTEYYAAVTAVDAAGHNSAVATFDFFVGITAFPTVQIAQDADDGLIVSDAPNHGSGHYPHDAYAGEWNANYRDYTYFRFQVPQNIPANSLIYNANLNIYALNENIWDESMDALEIWVQKDSDAPVVLDQTYYPGDTAGTVLSTASVPWQDLNSVGLIWRQNSWKKTPNLKVLLQELVNTYNGLAAGSHFQFWVGAKNIRGVAHEVHIGDTGAGYGPAKLDISFFPP